LVAVLSVDIFFVESCCTLTVVKYLQAASNEVVMSAISSILRWLDGESPGSSSRDDSQVMSSDANADDIPDNGSHLQTPPDEVSNEITNNNTHPDRSSVMAIEADLMEVSSKAVHAVKDWGSEYCNWYIHYMFRYWKQKLEFL